MYDLLVDRDADIAGIIPVAQKRAFTAVMADAFPAVLVDFQRAHARFDVGGHLAQHGRGYPAGQAHGLYLMIFLNMDHAVSRRLGA